MKLSKKTDYALRTVLELASHGANAQLTVGEIAASQSIPINFLEQILLTLKGAGLVASRRGQNGGYYLNQPPEAIKLAEIVRLTEGSLAPTECVGGEGGGCGRPNACPLREVWEDIHLYIADKLEGLTIADMCSRATELRQTQPPPSDFVI